MTVTRASGDGNLSVKTGASLTFTTSNWSTDQTVTLQAAQDADGIDGQATFSHAAVGGDYSGLSASLTATEDDNDRAVTLSKTDVVVPEGGTATYTVKLAAGAGRRGDGHGGAQDRQRPGHGPDGRHGPQHHRQPEHPGPSRSRTTRRRRR